MSLENDLTIIQDCTWIKDFDLTTQTTMRLSSRGDYVVVKTVDALQNVLRVLKKYNKNFLVLGWGANQILPASVEEIVLHLDFEVPTELSATLRDEYTLPASMGLNQLTSMAMKLGLMGWEVFTGIPASLGGAIYMNAGTNLGEIGKLVKSVTLINSHGDIREEKIHSKSFSYRKNHFVNPGEIIIGATLIHEGVDLKLAEKIKTYLDYRKTSQPLTTRNCGCVFKNPAKEMPAGKLIDLLGMKGVVLGDLRVSPKHGNFIENTGSGNWDQFSSLVDLIKFQMDLFYGIEFELEVKIPYD